MKTFFIEARAKLAVNFPIKHIDELPEVIGVATTAQHLLELPNVVQLLEKHGKKVFMIKGAHSKHAGQMLGCGFMKLENSEKVDAFLYIGTGLFHPQAFLLATGKPVFVYDPFNKHFFKMDKADMDKVNKKRKGAFLKFLHSDKVGVLISIKPGQNTVQAWLDEIMKVEQKYPDKKFYFIVFDTLDFVELENFTFVDCFLNTACPRLVDDFDKFNKPLVNLVDVMGYDR